MENLPPNESGIMDKFMIENTEAESYFGYQYIGYVLVPQKGIISSP